MFGLLGHNNISAGCTVRYHITVMFIQILPLLLLHTLCTHSSAGHFLPPIQTNARSVTSVKRTITPQTWSWSGECSCLVLPFLNCVHCVLCVMITVQYGDDASRLHALHASVHQSSISPSDSCGSSAASGGYHSSRVDNKAQFCSIC